MGDSGRGPLGLEVDRSCSGGVSPIDSPGLCWVLLVEQSLITPFPLTSSLLSLLSNLRLTVEGG